jgi:ATP-dependent RNA helicase DDX19/DBP5
MENKKGLQMEEKEEEEEQGEGNKFLEVNEDDEANTQVTAPGGQDISSKINMDYVKSNKTWDELGVSEEIKSKLLVKGFKAPSKIQYQVLNLLNQFAKDNQHTDIVAQSQNGSGKTLSFLIPSLLRVSKDHLSTANKPSPQVIIIGDTKELIYQTFKILNLIKPDWVKTDYFYKEKSESADINAHIVLGTADHLCHLFEKGALIFDKLRLFILDEADKLIDSDSVKNKLPKLLKGIPKSAIVGLFSATLPEKCLEILEKLKRLVTKIQVKNKTDLNLKNLKHFYIRCHRGQKLGFINNFLKKITTGSVIIFTNSKKFADDFTRKLADNGHKAEILLGDMDINDRQKILDDFKAGKIKILVSTNLLSRGIDARKVSLVINLDMPYTFKKTADRSEDSRDKLDLETYLHRVGRTARFGDMGVALNIIEDDRSEKDIQLIENEYGIKMHKVTAHDFEEIVSNNVENNSFNQEKRKQLEEEI